MGSSQPFGLPVLTEQNLHARVHTEPISINVAVPRPQHSAMFGHFDSAHTVFNLWPCTISRTASYCAPDGNFTRSHGGLRLASGTLLAAFGRMPPLTARVPCGLTNLLPSGIGTLSDMRGAAGKLATVSRGLRPRALMHIKRPARLHGQCVESAALGRHQPEFGRGLRVARTQQPFDIRRREWVRI